MEPANQSAPIERDEALECRDPAAVNVEDPPTFPNQCPNCGRAANVPLATEKLFIRNVRVRSDDRLLVRFDIPYCQTCALVHQSESQPRRRRLLRRIFNRGGTAIYLLLAGSALALIAWFDPFGRVASYSLWQRILIPAGVLLGGAVLLAIALWQTRFMTCLPPTSITSAVDFSDILSRNFEPRWRHFRFRRADYACAFSEVNHTRIWSATSAEAQRGERWGRRFRRIERWVVRVAIVAFIVWAVLQWRK
jgi:hypothetical protein